MFRVWFRGVSKILLGGLTCLALPWQALGQPAIECASTYALYDKGPNEATPEAQWTALFEACRAKAEQGDARSRYILGEMYRLGPPKAPAEDMAQALSLFNQAASQGETDAMFSLGLVYETGDGVPPDTMKALRWYKTSADGGNAQAQYYLGRLFRNGRLVPQSDADAFQWISSAARQGHERAIKDLATMYHEGQGVDIDHAEEMKWFRRGAENGDGVAQFNLGEGYANGHGMEQDLVRGYMWINLAGARGVGLGSKGPVAEGKRALAEQMSPEDLARAQKMSTACFMSEFKGC